MNFFFWCGRGAKPQEKSYYTDVSRGQPTPIQSAKNTCLVSGRGTSYIAIPNERLHPMFANASATLLASR